jgi:hypothetical protein
MLVVGSAVVLVVGFPLKKVPNEVYLSALRLYF